MTPFEGGGGGVLGLFSSKYSSSLLKFRPEVVSHKTKKVYEQSFKIKCLSRNGMHPKLTVLVHFGAKFTPGKPKILPKKTFSQKLHPYDYQITEVPDRR